MPGTSAICSGVASSSASIERKWRGERAGVDEADALDAERRTARGRTAAPSSASIAVDEVARRDLAEALQRRELLGVEVVDAGDAVDQPVLEELARALLAQPLDVHRAAAHELLDRLEQLARAARAVGADRPHAVVGPAPSACRTPGTAPAPSGSGERFLRFCAFAVGRDHARDHVAGARDDHLVALAHVLARDVLLVVERGELHRHARDLHRLELGERHHVPGAAHVPHHPLERGGGGHRRELPGDRAARLAPDHAEPALQVQVVHLHHHAVDLEVQRLAPLLPALAGRRPPRRGVVALDVGVHREARARAATRATRDWLSNSIPSSAPTE